MGVLEWEDLNEVTLVGHSYGGMIITAVADRTPERLSRLVYLDAVWPVDGESDAEIIGDEGMQMIGQLQTDPDQPSRILGAAEFAQVLGATDPDDIEWLASKLTVHPQGTLTQPIRLDHADPGVPVLYIACTAGYRGDGEGALDLSPSRAKARAVNDPTVQVVALDAPHNAMVTHPGELTALLVS